MIRDDIDPKVGFHEENWQIVSAFSAPQQAHQRPIWSHTLESVMLRDLSASSQRCLATSFI